MSIAHNLAREIEVFQTWVREMEEKPEIETSEDAYSCLRAVLQTLRDRLTPDEAAHLSAQLPAIARGIYYEGWKPSRVPEDYNLQEFYDKVRARLNGRCANADPGLIARHVFEVMADHMSEGQLDHIQATLPKQFDALWPQRVLM